MTDPLAAAVRSAADDAGAAAVAVAYRDLETGAAGGLDQDRWFHAASTIKLAVLVALHDAMARGRIRPGARAHVRNQFPSLVDGRYFRVEAGREADAAVHGHIGRTMRIEDLARHMIATSSNLATNVLVDLLGPTEIRGTLARLGIDGLEFRRGVEDERAWAAGINNRVTARGLADLLELIAEERAVSVGAARAMREVLHDQEHVAGIPAGVPDSARVANKTGEISTVTHDAGIVYLPERAPYVIVVLTEWEGERDAGGRRSLIAEISRLVTEAVMEAPHG